MESIGLKTKIVTPEGVELSYEPAGFVSRVLAAAIDLLVLMAGLFVLSILFGLLAASGGTGGIEVFMFVLIGVVWMVGYPIAMEVQRKGRTIGKSALGIRVITVNGLPLRVRHSFIRSALGLVELYFSFGAVASVAAISNIHGQRIGDFAAGTLVVRNPSVDFNSGPMRFAPPTHMSSFSDSLDISSVNTRLHDVVRSFLLRFYEFEDEVQESLAEKIYANLADELQDQKPPLMNQAVFLSCVAAKYQASHTSVVLPGAQLLAVSSAKANNDFASTDVASLLAALESESTSTESPIEP